MFECFSPAPFTSRYGLSMLTRIALALGTVALLSACGEGPVPPSARSDATTDVVTSQEPTSQPETHTSQPAPEPEPKPSKSAKPRPTESDALTGDDLLLSRFHDGTTPGLEEAFSDPVQVARAICGDWNNGVAWEGIFANFAAYDSVEVAYFMAASGEAYCPSLFQYMEERVFG